jgi:hypothetical protein
LRHWQGSTLAARNKRLFFVIIPAFALHGSLPKKNCGDKPESGRIRAQAAESGPAAALMQQLIKDS